MTCNQLWAMDFLQESWDENSTATATFFDMIFMKPIGFLMSSVLPWLNVSEGAIAPSHPTAPGTGRELLTAQDRLLGP